MLSFRKFLFLLIITVVIFLLLSRLHSLSTSTAVAKINHSQYKSPVLLLHASLLLCANPSLTQLLQQKPLQVKKQEKAFNLLCGWCVVYDLVFPSCDAVTFLHSTKS